MIELIIAAFREFAEGKGLTLPDKIIADGTAQRFHIEGGKPGNQNGAYVLHVDGVPNGWVQDWRKKKHDWKPPKGSFLGVNMPTQADIRVQKQTRADETADKHEAAALVAQSEWDRAKIPDANDSHPYLDRKGLTSFHNAKLYGDKLIIPIVNSSGEIVSRQFIDNDGNKRLLKGGKKQGNWSIINTIDTADIQTVIIGEGFATVASIIEDDYCSGEGDTAGTVLGVMAIDAGNLEPVATSMREQYPDIKIIIAADNDKKGLAEANKAAKAIGAYVIFPPVDGADFSDYLTLPKENQSQTLEEIISNAEYIEQEHQEESFSYSWKDRLLAHVEYFNEEYAQVLIGGKHRIMRIDRHKGVIIFIDQKDFEKINQHRHIQTGFKENGKPRFETLAKAWLQHNNCRTYPRGVIFDPALPPGNCGNEQFNLWLGFAVTPKENHDLTAAIRYHIENIVCSGDQQLIEYFYNWVAYTVQHPNKPAGAALVLRGEKGSGKGTMGHFLNTIWGDHGKHISNSIHLTGKFNAHLAECCFLFCDEAFFAGNKSDEGVLKALITEPVLMVERKGFDCIQQKNYLKVFMATNSDYAVPASRDERRYCVFDISSERIGDKDYFNALHKDCENKDVQAAFLFGMLNRDISQFRTGGIPESVGLQEQRLNSLNTVGKWLVDSLVAGEFVKDRDGTTLNLDDQMGVKSASLHGSYLFWCETRKINQYEIKSLTAFGRYFIDLGFNRVRRANGNYWYLESIGQAIEKLEHYEKISIDGVKTPKKKLLPLAA